MIDEKTLRFVRFFFTRYRFQSILTVVFLGLAGLMEGVGVATLLPVLELVNGGMDRSGGVGAFVTRSLAAVGLEPTVPLLLAIIFLAILVKSAFVFLGMTQARATMIWLMEDLRNRLLSGLLRTRWRYFAKERVGIWANAVSQEAISALNGFRESCEIIAAIFPITAYLVLGATISWQTSVFALFAGGVLLGVFRGFSAINRRVAGVTAVLNRSLAGLTVDVMQGLKPIKAMAREPLVEPIFKDVVHELSAAQRHSMFATEKIRFLQEPILTLFLASGIFVLFRIGDLPLSSVIVLAFVFYRIMQHLNSLILRYQAVLAGEASFWSLMEQIEAAEREQERPHGGVVPGPLKDELSIEAVTFSYGGPRVLDGVDLTIRAGTFVSILGESGSGKTTMADLVVGLHDPTEGRILVDGRDLREIDLRAWRSQLGYVPQEMLLLNDTIRKNVTLGDPMLTDADAEHALRLAGAWDFVSRNPQGLDAQVGERGTMLSGGQRQRVAIARALATRPSILILDEVTTALDPATEAGICQTLRGLGGDVTILSISHQPAMLEVADEAYMMRAGKLYPARAGASVGSHADA